MAMNLDAAIRLSAQVSGANNIRSMETGLQGLQRATQLSKADLGRWNIEINRAARESGNTVAGIQAHAKALGNLRERVDIGSNAYKRLGNEIAAANAKLKQLQAEDLNVNINTTNTGGSGVIAGLAAGAAAGVGAGVAANAVRSAGALRLLASGFDESTMSAQRFALVMNQAPGSSAAKLQAQIQGLRTQLAALKIQSDEYVSTLTRVRELETLQSFRSGRAEAIASNRAMSGATISRGYGSNARLATLPNTIAADNVRVAELTQRMQNLTRNTLEYNAARREMADVQSRLSADNAVPIMGSVAGIAATAGLAAAGALAMSAAQNNLELEKQARAVRTLTSNYGAMSVAIQEMVRQQGYQISTADATAQAYEVLSSGFTKQADVIKILSAASDGATGGFASMSQVVDGTTSVLNSYGRTAEDARRVVDALIQVQNDGKIKVGEFAEQIGRIAPTAVAAGVSLEEMLAGISALSIGGIKPEQAISGLNQAIVSIIRPTDKARELAKSLGLEFSAQALQAKGLSGFLKDVQEKTRGSTLATSILFSDMDGQRAVLRLTSDQLVTYNGHLANQRNLTGQAATAARKAVDPLQQFNNAWKDLTITFTAGVLPALTGGVQLLTQMIGVLTSPQAKAAIGFGMELSGWLQAPALKAQSMTLFGGGGSPGAVPVRTGGTGGRGSWGRADIRPPSRPVDPAIEAKALAVLNGSSGGGSNAARNRPDFPAFISADQMRAWLKSQGYERTSGDYTNRGHRTREHMLNAIDTGELDGPYPQAVQRAKALERTLRATGAFGDQLFGPISRPRDHKDHVHIPTPGGRVKVTPALAQLMGVGGRGGMGASMAEWQNTAEDTKARAAEVAADQLATARQLLNADEASFKVAQARDPLLKAAAEFDQQRNDRMSEYVELFRNAKSDEERSLIASSQGLKIKAAEADYQDGVLKILEQQRDLQAEIPGLMRAAGEEAGKVFAIMQQQQELTMGEGLSSGLNGYIESVGSAGEQTKAFVEQGLGGLSDAIVELSTTGANGFGQFVSSLLKDMARLVIQTQVLIPLLRALRGGGDGVPLAFTPGLNLAGGFGSNVMSGFDVAGSLLPGLGLPFAKGGIASGPDSGYPATLHGTEAVIPLPDGKRIPVSLRLPFQGQSSDEASSDLPPLAQPYAKGPSSDLPTLALPYAKGPSSGGRMSAAEQQAEAMAIAMSDKPLRIEYGRVGTGDLPFVTEDQHQRGLMQAAMAGETRVLARIRNSPATRRRAGIRDR